MALFWGKYWKTKKEATAIRKKHTYGYGIIKKTKKGYGIYADTPATLGKKLKKAKATTTDYKVLDKLKIKYK